jgi:signal transduction histidine kinase
MPVNSELIDDERALERRAPRVRRGAAAAALRAELLESRQHVADLTERLSQADRRYAELFDFFPIPFVTLDRGGLVLDINLAGTALLKPQRARIVGMPLRHYVASSHRRTFLEHMRRCRYDEGPIVTELLFRSDSDALMPVEITSRRTPSDSAGCNATEFFTILFELTERRRAEDRLRRSERLAALGTLAAGLAHEINNPLQAILLSAQLTSSRADHCQQPACSAAAMREIIDQSTRCSRIVRNMLRFVRDEPTQKWPTQLNAIVQRSVGVARSYGCQFDCVLTLTRRPTRILANPTQIEQVLVNLIKNASEAGAGNIRLDVATECINGSVRLTVDDNGPGISSADLPHVFDPFFSTKRGQGGTGLGLTLVHVIIAEHGGRIAIEPRSSGGTRVTIDLPRDATGAGHPGGGAADTHERKTNGKSTRRR